MLKPRKSNPCVRWTIWVFSWERERPRLSNHSCRVLTACSASSLLSQNTTKSSAYLTTARGPRISPLLLCLTPKASSMPCSAIFANRGLITPPTIWQNTAVRAWATGGRGHSKDDRHLLFVNLHAPDHRANNLAPREPVGRCQPAAY